MEEIWKDIAGYEGLYQISNLGRVKSLERTVQRRKKTGVFTLRIHERILVFKSNGKYQIVSLSKGNEAKYPTVHRLVMEAFVPNPDNKPEIDHIDGNPLNNNVTNLRWCSRSENVLNPITSERRKMALRKNRKRWRPVQQFTKTGVFIAEYPSAKIAEEKTGVKNSNICNCCQGKPKYLSAGGFVWKYAD